MADLDEYRRLRDASRPCEAQAEGEAASESENVCGVCGGPGGSLCPECARTWEVAPTVSVDFGREPAWPAAALYSVPEGGGDPVLLGVVREGTLRISREEVERLGTTFPERPRR